MGQNWPVILPEIATSTSIQGSFTCRKSATWDPMALLPSRRPDHGLDGPRSKPEGDEIFHLSRPALGPTEPRVKLVPGIS